jgi:diguanylate cyclase (GGDEF)-like protein
MDVNAVFLTTVLMIHGLVTMTWWIAGSMLGLSRRAAEHWMLAAGANGLALSMLPLHALIGVPAHLLLANVLVTWGVISMRRGLQSFLRLRQTDVSHALFSVGIVVFNLLICLPMGWIHAGEVISTLAVGALLWRTAYENHGPLVFEFNDATARAHSSILGFAGALFMVGAVVMSVPGLLQWWEGVNPEVATFAMLILHMLLSITSAFMLGYMVVMRLVRKLEHLSHHDSLTGLLNRRAIEYLLDREYQRLQRFGEAFSLLIVDIDHFKRINDRLGHAAGDAVLCAIAQSLQGQAREVDRVARFGGEEFCVLLPHTLHEGAVLAAERLREAINQVSIDWEDENISVTISTGLATAENPQESLEELMRRADEALYQAKAEGRNRVVAAQRALAA